MIASPAMGKGSGDWFPAGLGAAPQGLPFYGNDMTVAALFAAARDGRVRQAYLFTGARGLGKKTLANAFAKALLCESPAQGHACGACPRCLAFDSGNNADAVYVRPAKKALGVDDIRAAREEANRRPYYSRYKVLILDTGGMTDAAQNALLKILEEPPGYVVFILLAEQEKQLLPTVLSRVARYSLRPVPTETVRRVIVERLAVDAVSAAECAAHAQGSVGEGLRMAASLEYAALRAEVAATLAALKPGDYIAALDAAKRLADRKDGLSDALSAAAFWYRAKLAEDISAAASIQAIERARRRLSQNANAQLTLEVLMMELG